MLNRLYARLSAAALVLVTDVPGVQFTQATQANGVFVRLPAGVADAVREHFFFYDWDAAPREVRWMCSFDTTESDVDEFASLIRQAVKTL